VLRFRRAGIGSDLWMQMSRSANRRISEGVWNEFSGRLRSFVSKRVREPADAKDIVQEIFLRIHANLPTLDDEARMPAWIFAIARNSIADHFRRKSRAAGILPSDFDLLLPAESHVEPTALSELSRCLEPMIQSLPKPYEEAIRLTEFGGMTQAAVAKHIGVSTSGMKTRVQRARQRLKRMLLECCDIEPDRRGGIVTYKPRTGGCNSCSEDTPTSACESSSGKGQKRSTGEPQVGQRATP
jgi:RNA polymerase sigma-70 factor, ECF subfamily